MSKENNHTNKKPAVFFMELFYFYFILITIILAITMIILWRSPSTSKVPASDAFTVCRHEDTYES